MYILENFRYNSLDIITSVAHKLYQINFPSSVVGISWERIGGFLLQLEQKTETERKIETEIALHACTEHVLISTCLVGMRHRFNYLRSKVMALVPCCNYRKSARASILKLHVSLIVNDLVLFTVKRTYICRFGTML